MPTPKNKNTAPEDKAKKLLELAEKQFGTLTSAEKKLFTAAAKGKIAIYRAGSEEDDDPANAGNWPEERKLEANRIAWLCTDHGAAALVTHRGVLIIGVRVDGELDLNFARIHFPLVVYGSAFAEDMNLMHTDIPCFFLPGTHTRSIYADGIKVDGNVFLRDGFRADGEVRLKNAKIGGNLYCSKCHLSNPEGYALCADTMKVDGSVFLSDGFKADGEVRLLGAIVGGDLVCSKGLFSNPEGDALCADRIKVDGSVFLHDGFESNGEVGLSGAKIGGDLGCKNCHFSNPEGYALCADRMKVDGSVFLCEGFKADGMVCLLGAKIGGNLECGKGLLSNPGGDALCADGMKVEGSVFLRNGFGAEGKVSLVSATIAKHLVCAGVESPDKVTLDLRSARIGTFRDKEKSWPDPGRLLLHDFVYDEIGDDAPKDAEARIGWLRRQPSGQFQPQPYEQLAKVLRNSGHMNAAKRVLYDKEEDPARVAQLTRAGRVWNYIYGKLIGYGYYPSRALWIALAFLLVGAVFFAMGSRADIITPTKKLAYVDGSTVNDRGISEDYPVFVSLVYSIDAFVPLMDFHQVSFWLPNPNKGKVLLQANGCCFRYGGLLSVYLWFHIVSGWFLTSLLVVSLNKMIRN